MAIISTTISDDVIKSDRDLTVDVQNKFEYTFDPAIDLFLDGFGSNPAPFIGTPSDEQIRDGYFARLVAREDVDIQVYLEGDDSPFHIKTVQINYYVQRKEDSGSGPSDLERDGAESDGGGTSDGSTNDGTIGGEEEEDSGGLLSSDLESA